MNASNLDLFDTMIAEHCAGLDPAGVEQELQHIAEHLGMGDMRQLHVTLDQVRAFFARMRPAMQRAALADIDVCPW